MANNKRKITDEELATVKALAESASGSSWSFSEGGTQATDGDIAHGVDIAPGASLTWDDHSGEVFTREDALFIAATDPEFILALIADRNYWKQEAADNLRMAEEQNSLAQQG